MFTVFFLSTIALSADAELVVTAAREPVAASHTGGSLTVIDGAIDALALPQLVDYLRLAPGVSVSRSGPTGSQTQVRLRGAESNHSLVFIDGIEANDPASSGDFRWETLAADGIERIEVLRGPQSALWGSEAIGGVVAITSRTPEAGTHVFGNGEAGSFDTYRAAAGLNVGSESAGIVVQSNYTDTDGIDSFSSGPVERDGFENFAVSIKASVKPSPSGELGLVARYMNSLTEFDGFDPATFLRADTEDSTRIRGSALRGFARVEALGGRWRHEVFGTYLSTDNINRNAGTFLNRSDAETFRTGYQTGLDFVTGQLEHRLTGAAEYRTQRYLADDESFFGGTKQRQSRDRTSLVVDYGLAAGSLALAASLRHDDNDKFGDATTWRASGRYGFGGNWSVHASAGEGVTDPTFTEMFGFFPGNFVGNPDLTPEQSFGWDAGIRYVRDGFSADVTYFDADLESEIVTTFDFVNFLSGVANADGKSKRRGIEVSAQAKPRDWLTLDAGYTWLDAEEKMTAGNAFVREVRRARHSGYAAATADLGIASLAFAANYVGKRRDIDFDSFPARDVTLGDYVLAALTAHVPLGERFELTGRVENLFDAEYEDVFGYTTQGISAFGGVRMRWGG